MSSPNPHPDNELDGLIRRALQARAGKQEPPDRVWKQIQLGLDAGKAPPRRLRAPWSPLVVQVALTLLLVMVGGMGLQRLLNPGGVGPSQGDVLPSVPTAYLNKFSAPTGTTGISDEADIQLLRTLSKPNLTPKVKTESGDHPPLIIPQDVPHHPWSPEGRLLAAERSVAPFLAMPSEVVFGGPAER